MVKECEALSKLVSGFLTANFNAIKPAARYPEHADTAVADGEEVDYWQVPGATTTDDTSAHEAPKVGISALLRQRHSRLSTVTEVDGDDETATASTTTRRSLGASV